MLRTRRTTTTARAASPLSATMLAAAAVLTATVILVTVGCSAVGANARSADPEAASKPGAATTHPATTGAAKARVTLPPTVGSFDYQLGGDYTPPKSVKVVTRDSTSKPAKGLYSICYVNGFQTQPGVAWPSDLILKTKAGKPVVDPGWPDEHIIDISTAAKRKAAAARIAKSTDACAARGFKAVEFDNLDSYSRSRGALTLGEAIAYAKLLVTEAHAKGLAAGQKNTGQLGSRGKTQIGYDFAVSEECDTYDECATFTKVYGAHVLDIEYTDDVRGTFAQVCARKATPRQTILRDRDLTTPADKAYVYRSC